ncbi:MAG: hypothetical protein IKL46_04590 [Clostridia bacterium]|nr:hypothetical protein [Clostridia bacterium]
MKKDISPKIRAFRKLYVYSLILLLISFVIGLFVSVLLNIPIGFILGETSNLADGITGTLATVITLFLLNFKYGYYENRATLAQLLLVVLSISALQIFITIMLGHSVWFTGPTMSFARYVFELRHPDMIGVIGAKKIVAEYNWIFMIIAFWVLYAPSMILGKYLGSKKGRKDSLKAKEEKSKEKTLNEHPFD